MVATTRSSVGVLVPDAGMESKVEVPDNQLLQLKLKLLETLFTMEKSKSTHLMKFEVLELIFGFLLIQKISSKCY